MGTSIGSLKQSNGRQNQIQTYSTAVMMRASSDSSEMEHKSCKMTGLSLDRAGKTLMKGWG